MAVIYEPKFTIIEQEKRGKNLFHFKANKDNGSGFKPFMAPARCVCSNYGVGEINNKRVISFVRASERALTKPKLKSCSQ